MFPLSKTTLLLLLALLFLQTQSHVLPSYSPPSIPVRREAKLNLRQPTPNPLDFLDLKTSSVYSSTKQVPLSDECGAGMVDGALGFPHARFTNALAGQVECSRRLVFKDLPLGFGFSVIAAQIDGFARVGRGGWLDRVKAEVEYFGLEAQGQINSTLTDQGSDLELGRKYYGPYSGAFNLTVNVFPGDETSRTARGRTRCATEGSQPEMAVRFRLTSSHERFDIDDSNMYRATVSDVRVGFHVLWERCES